MKHPHLADLLRRVAEGDRAAFSVLYHDTSDALFGVLMRMLRNRANAEDGLQEVFSRIWQRASGFDPSRGSGMTWMMTIARNYAIDQRRQHQMVAVDDIAVDDLADPGWGPGDVLVAQGTVDRIRFCLGQLEKRQADCIKRAYLDGMTYADLAARHVVPINTMRTWLRRGLMKLRDCVLE